MESCWQMAPGWQNVPSQSSKSIFSFKAYEKCHDWVGGFYILYGLKLIMLGVSFKMGHGHLLKCEGMIFFVLLNEGIHSEIFQ